MTIGGSAMATSGERCRRCGHAGSFLADPYRNPSVRRSNRQMLIYAGGTSDSGVYGDRAGRPLFKHLVGAQQDRLRHSEAERLGGFGV